LVYRYVIFSLNQNYILKYLGNVPMSLDKDNWENFDMEKARDVPVNGSEASARRGSVDRSCAAEMRTAPAAFRAKNIHRI
jgi:hypothetical protein